jgi:hypothetical protein
MESRASGNVPAGYHTVTPWIIARGAGELIDFFKQAFGAEELARIYVADNFIGHAGDRIGRVRDPKGNVWWIQTHVRDVPFERMMNPTPAEQQAMQDAQATLDRELAGRTRE